MAVSCVTMGASAATKAVVSVIIVALMLFCVGDVVHAFMPGSGENTDCDGSFCNDHTGCGTGPSVKLQAPPIITLTTPVVIASPPDSISRRQIVEPFFFGLRPVPSLAPRSPPSA